MNTLLDCTDASPAPVAEVYLKRELRVFEAVSCRIADGHVHALGRWRSWSGALHERTIFYTNERCYSWARSEVREIRWLERPRFEHGAEIVEAVGSP